MTARHTWIDSLSDGFFEASLDRTLRRLIMVYRKRERMSARRFGDMALGDRGFISHRLKRGSSVGLKTADTVLAFMGEPLFGPWFRCEVETFIAITGSKAHWLGHYAVNDPSFVSRLRRGASPRLPPAVRVLEPLALDREVTEILMEGGGDLPVYTCDTPLQCLNPTLGRVTIPADRGLRARVAGLMRDLVDAVRNDTVPPAPALGLVNLTTLPVYRVINAAAAYRGAVIDQEVDALAEAVALDVLQVWISDLHRTIEARAGTLDSADGTQLERWRQTLRENRIALSTHRQEGLQRFNTALAVVEKLRLIETELAGALSADLRAALAFSRGQGGVGGR